MHESHSQGESSALTKALQIPLDPTLAKPSERIRQVVETAFVVVIFAALAAAGVQMCVRVLP